MNTATSPIVRSRGERWADEALGLLTGVGFTLALFLTIAQVERTPTPAPTMVAEDLRVMAAPPEEPPPVRKITESTAASAGGAPVTGLEIAPSDSPMRITVVPPDIESLIPPTSAPSALIRPAQLYTELKPRSDYATDFQRIFQSFEVDQKPAIVSRPTPRVPSWIRGNADSLRVTLLIFVDANGAVGNIRILKSSGSESFDRIILADVRQAWIFSPAMKSGRRVKCLLQQTVRVNWQGASPFES